MIIFFNKLILIINKINISNGIANSLKYLLLIIGKLRRDPIPINPKFDRTVDHLIFDSNE